MGALCPNEMAVTNTKINANAKIWREADVVPSPMALFLSHGCAIQTNIVDRLWFISAVINLPKLLSVSIALHSDRGQAQKPRG